MPGNLTIVDKKTQSGTFRYEKRIKSSEFRENVDYTFDEMKSIYTILSPRLAKDILIIQNPYNENIDVSDIVVKVLVDYRSEINIKPQIVIDLEKREGLIEVSKGRNNFPQSLPPSRTNRLVGKRGVKSPQIMEIDDEEARQIETTEVGSSQGVENDDKYFIDSNDGGLVGSQTPNYDNWTVEQFIAEINRLKVENEQLKNNQTLTSSEQQERLQQNQQSLSQVQSFLSSKDTQQNNSFTPLFIGGTVLVVIGLISILVIKNTKKKLK